MCLFGGDITAVEQTACHVLAIARIALHHLIAGLEARVGHLRDAVLLVMCLIGGDERRICGEREVNTREGNQVGLELVQVDVEGTVKAERCGDRGHHLRDDSVEVRETRLRNTELLLTDVEDGFVVDLKTSVSIPIINMEYVRRLTMNEQSECSSVVCVVSTELYGSTIELDSWGAGYTQNSSFDFLP